MTNKNMQVPEKLLIDVYKLVNHLKQYELSSDIETLAKDIEAQLGAKMERMERRKLYTESKIGETREKKEIARCEYIEKAGISENYQY